MKEILHRYLWIGLLALPCSALAQDAGMKIVTANEAGTYYQFGRNMRDLVARHGIALEVLPSTGSIENMLVIHDSRGTQLGMAQSDVTLFMNLLGDKETKEIARSIEVVFPLYDEEIHLLAKNDIGGLADLNDKIVALGRIGSGSAMTANLLLEVAKIKPAEKRDIGAEDAVAALRSGEIDAMFLVAGNPYGLLAQSVTADDGLHLVPITEESVLEIFGTPTAIPASAYPWQNEDVQTIAIKANLMTYDYPEDDENCALVGRFAKTIYDNLDWLKQNGHEKWDSVDLNATVHVSLQSACALAGLQQ